MAATQLLAAFSSVVTGGFSPAFHDLPHFKHVHFTLPLPIPPAANPTGPANKPPATALPAEKPFLFAEISVLPQ